MKRIRTKEKLLNVTLELISEKGYLGTTTREIALQAGVTEPTLFRHFGSKERLFEAMLERFGFLPTLRELMPQLESLPLDEALRFVGVHFIQTLKRRKAMVRILCSEITVYPEKVKEVFTRFIDEMYQMLADYLRQLQQQGQVREFPAEFAAQAFFGMLFSYFRIEEIVRMRDIDEPELREHVAAFVDLLVHGTCVA